MIDLRSDEIDPQVARKLSDFLQARWDRRRDEVSRAWSVLCARVSVFLVPVLLLMLLALGLYPVYPLSYTLLTLLVVGSAWLGGSVYFRLSGPRHPPDVFTPELIRLALGAPSLTPVEKAYASLLPTLLSASSALGESAVRDMLPSLNELLQNARDLEAQRQPLLATVDDTTSVGLMQQRDELARHLEQSTDAVARQTMRQSLELCEARLEDLRQLESHLARLDAQRELISQMLASVQFSLARLQVAPTLMATTDVHELHQSVVHLNQQARAVEQAVQEVTALRRI